MALLSLRADWGRLKLGQIEGEAVEGLQEGPRSLSWRSPPPEMGRAGAGARAAVWERKERHNCEMTVGVFCA